MPIAVNVRHLSKIARAVSISEIEVSVSSRLPRRNALKYLQRRLRVLFYFILSFVTRFMRELCIKAAVYSPTVKRLSERRGVAKGERKRDRKREKGREKFVKSTETASRR